MAAVKRARLEEENPKEQEPKLKCHEMRLIFQRLPTSELVRFISRQPKHPLGKFWSQELKFVVEKRLPFSIKATASSRGGGTPFDHVIFDCNGSRVAEIKRPEHFHLAPVCELIESAELQAIARKGSSLPPRFVFPTPDILSTLKNMDKLSLSTHHMIGPKLQMPVDHLPTSLSPEIMSRIKSLTLACYNTEERFEKQALVVLARSSNLKSLCLILSHHNVQTWLAALPHETDGHSGLQSLNVAGLDEAHPFLETLVTRFNGLHQLFLPIRAPMRLYLAAFQALTSLAKLGLDANPIFKQDNEKNFSVDENDVSIVSVTELFVMWYYPAVKDQHAQALLAVLSKFPNVRTFGAEFSCCCLLRFTSAICSSGVFGRLEALKLFTLQQDRAALLQFIRANIDHLPSSVDLSQAVAARPGKLDRDFLVDLCLALRGGRITSFVLGDFVHREAVDRLRDHFVLTKQETHVDGGKVLAWFEEVSIQEGLIKSKAAWWPGEVSECTDFRIEARKASGPLKGSAFKVRISNPENALSKPARVSK